MKYALLTILALLPSSAVASLDQTVGWTGGCTCVVVTADGYALSAEHCGHDSAFTVEIAGRTVQARKIHEPPKNSTDEAVLLKLDGGPFEFAPISDTPVKRGDPVSSWGFPAGKLSFISGTVNMVTSTGDITGDFAAVGGHSGGPLFNAAGQVCGLLSTSDRKSITGWIGLPAIQRAMRFAQGVQSPVPSVGNDRIVWVLTSDGCLPCENLKADYRRGQFPGVEMKFIDLNSAAGQVLAGRIEEATGRRPAFTPTLWAEGEEKFTTGYSGVGTMRSWLVTALRLPLTFWETITGDRQPVPGEPIPPELLDPQPELKPIPQDNGMVPEPVDPEEIMFDGVTVIFTAAAQDVSALRGGARRLALEQLIPAIERQFAELTGGDARLAVVPERTLPTRYAAVTEAAEIPGDGWHVLVLVPAQSSGIRQLIRSKVAELVRDRLPDAVRDAPVGLLSETVSEGVYRATIAALDTPEPPPPPAAQDPVEGGDPVSDGSQLQLMLAALVGFLKRLFAGRSG